jgi:excisionase family DNA binding protein
MVARSQNHPTEIVGPTSRQAQSAVPGSPLTRSRLRHPSLEEHGRLLLTVEDAASVLQIGRTRVFGLISNGVLSSVKIGRSRRIRRRDLEAYVASLDVAP